MWGIGESIDLSEYESKIYKLIKDKLSIGYSTYLIELNTKNTYRYGEFNFMANGKTIIGKRYEVFQNLRYL